MYFNKLEMEAIILALRTAYDDEKNNLYIDPKIKKAAKSAIRRMEKQYIKVFGHKMGEDE